MISAEKDRDSAGPRQLISAPAQCPGPALDLPVVLRIVRRSISQFGHIADREVAVVFHFKTQPAEHRQKTGRPQSSWPHQGSALRRANIDGGAEHRNSF